MGPPGVGKTTLALTFPRPFVINTDDGLIAPALKGVQALVAPAATAQDFEKAYYWCRDHRDAYDTIVIDSADEMIRPLLDQIVDEGKGQRRNTTVTDVVPEQAEYYANQRQMHRILTQFRTFKDKHIVVVSGVRDRDGKKGPNVTPGLLPIVTHFSDVMGSYELVPLHEGEAPSRVLVTGTQYNSETKTRFDSLAPYVVEPTFEKLWTLVQAERNNKGE